MIQPLQAWIQTFALVNLIFEELEIAAWSLKHFHNAVFPLEHCCYLVHIVASRKIIFYKLAWSGGGGATSSRVEQNRII